MNLKSLICRVTLGILIVSSWTMVSCDSFKEDLPECRLSVKFKYDYNMEFADAFHTQVDKVELYVFDKDGKFLFKQAEEGGSLSTGNYLMEVALPVGEYQFVAWAGARDSYDITSLIPETSTITDLKLQLKREESLIIDKELETRMELAQKVSSMGLALRKKINIIVKQPLQKLMIPVDALMKERLESVKSLIMNEVNIKEIDFVEGTSNLLVKKVKCNFKILGKKFGSLMKQVAAAVTAMNQEQISVLENEGKIVLDLNGTPAEIETSEVEIFSEDIPGWVVANEGVLTVALDTVVTEELRREGIARELVSKIQNIRKGSGFEITDKIKVSLSKNEQTDSAVKEYNTYICNQVLANSLNLVDEVKDGIELSFDDFSLYVSVVKE